MSLIAVVPTFPTNTSTSTGGGKNTSIADVRKALQYIREKWKRHSPNEPIFLSERLSNGMTMEYFAYIHVLNHHEKRHCKSAASKAAMLGIEPQKGTKRKRHERGED